MRSTFRRLGLKVSQLVALIVLSHALFLSVSTLANGSCTALIEQVKAGNARALEDPKAIEGCDKLADLEDALNQLKRKLGDVSQKVTQAKVRGTAAAAPIEPALQWAQSPDNVFINVKFAHKLDAPACLDLVDPTIDIEESRVMVRAGCKDKTFKLDLVLYSSIVKTNSSWSMTSVGRGSFTLAKQAVSKWDRLLASRDKPKNLHVWWAMQEKFDGALSDLKDAREVNSASKSAPDATTEQTEAEEEAEEVQPEEDAPDPLTAPYEAARKKVQEQSKVAKKEIADKASARRAKLQKQIESVNEEEGRHLSSIEGETKAALSRLTNKLSALKTKRDGGETVEWVEEDWGLTDGGATKGQSFVANLARVLKKAFGVDEGVKDEV